MGAAAGIVAAAATSLFQTLWTYAHLPPTDKPSSTPPPTEKLADEISLAVNGSSLSKRERGPAGSIVHYVMGAGLGAAYAVLAKLYPDVTEGRGLLYGLGIWATVEEMGLALTGLKPPPWEVEPAEHAFAASSHVIFGLSLDAVLSILPGAPAHRPLHAYKELFR